MSFENKIKFSLWVYPKTMKDVEIHYKGDNCRLQSEFIERAIKFYIGYLDEEKSVNYLSPMITETVKATIKGTEQRLARLLFKVAVELGKLSHMLAAANDVDEEMLRQLHIINSAEYRSFELDNESMGGSPLCVALLLTHRGEFFPEHFPFHYTVKLLQRIA